MLIQRGVGYALSPFYHLAMNYQNIIDKYYNEDNQLRYIFMTHSRLVTKRALKICDLHPELNLNRRFVEEAAMLHDIGIFLCNAPEIDCHGDAEYICHGYLGADLLRAEGYPRHALVSERHTGTGLSLEMIIERNLPVPHRDMQPESMEEQLICFADKFYSKTKLEKEKSVEKVRKGLVRFGDETLLRFDNWCKLFLGD